MLEGERAGQLMRIPDGIAPVVGIVEPFSWFPGVDETATPQAEGLVTAALSVGPSGVFITGGIIDGWGDGEHFGFSLDGRQTEDVRGNTPRFARWTIELCDVARPFHSLGILATIDRTERVV